MATKLQRVWFYSQVPNIMVVRKGKRDRPYLTIRIHQRR